MITINAKISPKAKKNELVWVDENNLKIKVTAAQERGRANKAVIDLLSASFNIPKNSVRIIRGKKSRAKLIEIDIEKYKVYNGMGGKQISF